MNPVENVIQGIVERHPEIAERLRQEGPRSSIAAALVRVRNALGLTQRDVARLMNKPQGNVARLEKATGNPQTTDALIEYANACGLTLGLVFVTQTPNGLAIMEATGIDQGSDEFLRHLITVKPVVRQPVAAVAAV